jgi:hypothetical protein
MASDNYPKLAGARPGPMATPASPPYAHDLLVALHAQHPEQQEGGAVTAVIWRVGEVFNKLDVPVLLITFIFWIW